MIHLREKIECLEFERNQLSASKVREENLTKQLKETTEELLEARRNHTPVSILGVLVTTAHQPPKDWNVCSYRKCTIS